MVPLASECLDVKTNAKCLPKLCTRRIMLMAGSESGWTTRGIRPGTEFLGLSEDEPRSATGATIVGKRSIL